jgi:hypothetical protein
VRIIPVLGSIPAVFGLVMASYVVTELAGMPVRPEPVLSIGLEHYSLLHERLVEREEVSAPPPGCWARRGPAASRWALLSALVAVQCCAPRVQINTQTRSFCDVHCSLVDS